MNGEREYLRSEWTNKREKELFIQRQNTVSEMKSIKIKLEELKTQNENIILLLESLKSSKKILKEDNKETYLPAARYTLTGWFMP